MYYEEFRKPCSELEKKIGENYVIQKLIKNKDLTTISFLYSVHALE